MLLIALLQMFVNSTVIPSEPGDVLPLVLEIASFISIDISASSAYNCAVVVFLIFKLFKKFLTSTFNEDEDKYTQLLKSTNSVNFSISVCTSSPLVVINVSILLFFAFGFKRLAGHLPGLFAYWNSFCLANIL